MNTTGLPKSLRLTAARTKINANRDNLSYAIVEVVDEAGQVIPYVSDLEVSYTISEVGNGNPVDVFSFQQKKKKVWLILLIAMHFNRV